MLKHQEKPTKVILTGKRRTGAIYQAKKSERIGAMVELYQNGKALREIGEIYGVTRERVRQILKQAGCQSRRYTRTELVLARRKRKPKHILDKTELAHLFYERKLLLKDIAKHFNVSLFSVRNNLKQYGFSRPHSCIKNPLLTNERLKYEYLELKKTAKEIGKIYGYSGATISNKLKRANIKKGKVPLRIEKEDLRLLYLDLNKTQKETAKIVGCCKETIQRYCKKYQFCKTNSQLIELRKRVRGKYK